MDIAISVKRFLDKQHISYSLSEFPAEASARNMATKLGAPDLAMIKGVPLHDRFGLVLAVIRVDQSIDHSLLSDLMGRTLEPASTAQVLRVFRDCDSAFIPPLGEAYGVRTIVDESLAAYDTLLLPSGNAESAFHIKSADFFRVQNSAWFCSHFTYTSKKRMSAGEAGNQVTNVEEGQKPNPRDMLKSIQQLPPMPKIAQEIIRLSGNPNADATDLASIIEMDPSLSAQILRYAHSPLFAYPREIDSIKTAISRVLGFDMVMNLALGLAAVKPFKVQRNGPLGLDGFWRHAVYSASLIQALVKQIPASQRPKAGTAYLAGLLHNFGHLLFGFLCKKEFMHLNEMLAADRDVRVTDLEKIIFGISHDEFGAILLSEWGLSEEITVAVREHHNSGYNGPNASYVRLVNLVDHTLHNHGMGDCENSELRVAAMESLGLSEVQILLAVNQVLEGCEGLNTMAQQLAA